MTYLDTSALIKRFVAERGFDAIHLGSALSLRDALGEEMVFAAIDARLLRAAEAEQLQVINVESASQLPD